MLFLNMLMITVLCVRGSKPEAYDKIDFVQSNSRSGDSDEHKSQSRPDADIMVHENMHKRTHRNNGFENKAIDVLKINKRGKLEKRYCKIIRKNELMNSRSDSYSEVMYFAYATHRVKKGLYFDLKNALKVDECKFSRIWIDDISLEHILAFLGVKETSGISIDKDNCVFKRVTIQMNADTPKVIYLCFAPRKALGGTVTISAEQIAAEFTERVDKDVAENAKMP